PRTEKLLAEVLSIYREVLANAKEYQVPTDLEFHKLLQPLAHEFQLRRTAEAQHNLGLALSTQAQKAKKEVAIPMLNEAVIMFREALKTCEALKTHTGEAPQEMRAKAAAGLKTAELHLERLQGGRNSGQLV